MTTDPIAGIRAAIEEMARETWPAEQARRLAAVLGEAGADAAIAADLPDLGWRQAVAVVNGGLGKRDTPSPQADPDVRERTIRQLAEWFGGEFLEAA